MDPVKSASRWVPYPTTTSSSPANTLVWSVTLISVRPFISICCVANPTKENMSTFLPSGTSKLYSPSTLVVVPIVVPCTVILTPGSGSPSSAEVTTPVTVSCALTTPAHKNTSKSIVDRLCNTLFNISIAIKKLI